MTSAHLLLYNSDPFVCRQGPHRVISYPKSDEFSRATKLEVKRLAGDLCWACSTSTPQVCHVFGKEDPQVSTCIKLGGGILSWSARFKLFVRY